MSQKRIEEGVRDAVAAYLELHDVSVPAAIEAGISTAMRQWLDANRDRIVERVSAQVRGEPIP